jgi:uncharacterized protein (TIGR03067 family)
MVGMIGRKIVRTCVLLALAVGGVLAPESGDEQATQDSKKLEAAWTATSVLRNSNELPAEQLKDLQIIFRDGSFTFKQGDKTLATGSFRLDPAKTPQAIDLTTTETDGTKKTTFAIYELADDLLRICGAQPGEERPSEFAAVDGSGHTLTTFQRANR